MPGVYFTACQKCGADVVETDWSYSLYWEGKDIPLVHPCESLELQEYQLTWDQAACNGILHCFEAYACRSCGVVTYVKLWRSQRRVPGSFCCLWLLSLVALRCL